MRPVIFDTDIGTDVDDILALVLLAKAPELNLLGITTVYGDTNFRARIARRTTQMLGRDEIKIVPGEGRPRSGRQVYWGDTKAKGSRIWMRSRSNRGNQGRLISVKPPKP